MGGERKRTMLVNTDGSGPEGSVSQSDVKWMSPFEVEQLSQRLEEEGKEINWIIDSAPKSDESPLTGVRIWLHRVFHG